jgi:hypothetical protein
MRNTKYSKIACLGDRDISETLFIVQDRIIYFLVVCNGKKIIQCRDVEFLCLYNILSTVLTGNGWINIWLIFAVYTIF